MVSYLTLRAHSSLTVSPSPFTWPRQFAPQQRPPCSSRLLASNHLPQISHSCSGLNPHFHKPISLLFPLSGFNKNQTFSESFLITNYKITFLRNTFPTPFHVFFFCFVLFFSPEHLPHPGYYVFLYLFLSTASLLLEYYTESGILGYFIHFYISSVQNRAQHPIDPQRFVE